MFGWNNTIAIPDYFADAAVLAVFFGIAFLVRRYATLFRRYLIPVSLLAGCIGFLTGPAVLDWVPFETDRMGFYVYHLLALTFIAVGLRKPKSRATVAAFHVGFVKTVTVLIQGLIGLGILFAFHVFLDPSLSPAVGMLLPLGFGMGPGIALSVGASWEVYGVAGAADAGLAIATVGFIVAYVVGVWAVNRGVRDGLVTIRSVHGEPENHHGEAQPRRNIALASGWIPALMALAASVVIVYGLTYAFMRFATTGLTRIGLSAEIPVLWSLNFLWANLIAMLFRKAVVAARPVVSGARSVFDHPVIDHAVAVLADLLVAAAVMAIGLTLARAYFVPLVLTCVVGSAVTYYVVRRSVAWAFDDHKFTRFAGLFGEQTGTVSSGLALIRIVDPGYRTPVARDQVLGSGTALLLGFPLLLLINLPLSRFGGSNFGYALVAVLMTVYLAIAAFAWWIVRGRVPKTISGGKESEVSS